MARPSVSRSRAWRVTPSTRLPLPYTPQSWQGHGVRGLAHPQLLAWFQSVVRLETLPPLILRVYREHPHSVYEIGTPAELDLPWSCLVVKRFGWRGVQHYLSSPLKRSRAMKAYRAACHLLAHGLATPLPLGVCEARRWGFVQYNVYMTAAIPDVITLQDYYATLPDGPAGLDEVLLLVAVYTRRMHDSGLWHRDLVTSNLLLSGPAGHRQVALVDLNRARRVPWMPLMLRAMDLARMGWHAQLPQLCAFYSAGRFSVTRLVWYIRLYRQWRTWRWHVRQALKPLRARLRV